MAEEKWERTPGGAVLMDGNRLRDELVVELKGRIEELESLREELQVLMSEGDAQRNERVEALIKMTESMRSAQAAAVLEEMDQDLAVEVLDGMNRGKAGKALAAMPPAKAAELAEALTLTPLQQAALD